MQNEHKLKDFMCEIGRRVYARGFAAANDGNFTIRLNEKEVLCTPTMVSKGYMKPEDICKIDYDGKQLAGVRKRSSEALLHLAIYRANPKINAVLHCHPPHATAFGIAHEPIPKCILPEVEVFLGEVPMAEYETPGTQKFADTVLPFVKDCNTIILANHGTVSFGDNLEMAYFNTEIVDAYCRMLILAKQLGRINYFSDQKTAELLALKKRLGIDDPRNRNENCDLCGNSIFRDGYTDFVPEPHAFRREESAGETCSCKTQHHPAASSNGHVEPGSDMDKLVRTITDQVMAALAGANV